MKIIGTILVGLFMVACAPALTLEELEDQANLTGDWTRVEKRERAIAKRQSLQCSTGYVAYCDGSLSRKKCSCERWSDVRAAIPSHW